MVLKESKWCLPKPPLPPEGRNNHPEVEAKSLSSRLPSWGLWAFWRRTIQCNSFQSTIPHQPRGNSETIREKLRGKVKVRERERERTDWPKLDTNPRGRKKGKGSILHDRHKELFPACSFHPIYPPHLVPVLILPWLFSLLVWVSFGWSKWKSEMSPSSLWKMSLCTKMSFPMGMDMGLCA